MNQTTDNHRQVAPAAASMVELVAAWTAATGSRVRLITELALAEAKLAAISVSLMVFLAMLAAAFVLGAWGLLLAGLVYGLLQLGWPLWPVLMVLGGLHALLAAAAWKMAVYLSQNLEFSHTRRQFGAAPEEEHEMASSAAQG